MAASRSWGSVEFSAWINRRATSPSMADKLSKTITRTRHGMGWDPGSIPCRGIGARVMPTVHHGYEEVTQSQSKCAACGPAPGRKRLNGLLAAARLRQAIGDGLPVDDAPPGIDVVRPLVLVLQVVGVLPHVDAEDRCVALHQRAVLVRGAVDLQGLAVPREPGPTAAEAARRGGLHLVLELGEAREGVVNRRFQLAARLPPAAFPRRRHDLPEHRMVMMPAAVVLHRRANALRH